MSRISFQTNLISLIKSIAPHMTFIACYDTTTIGIKSCMHEYGKRSFIYILTADFEESEYCIYIGKTKSQYTRFANHIKKYEFDHIYLFECTPDTLTKIEGEVINEIKPLYNRNNNPLEERYHKIFNIDYNEIKTKKIINHHLKLLKKYEETGLFGFSLNPAIFSALEMKAKEKGVNCSEMLQIILEQHFHTSIATQLQSDQTLSKTNLITINEYANLHDCSRESIKQFLQEENRINGAKHIGRDWVLPKDAHFPEDRRKKRQKKIIDLF